MELYVYLILAAAASTAFVFAAGWYAHQERVDMKNVERRLKRPF